MKAGVLYAPNTPLVIEDLDYPDPAPGEVLAPHPAGGLPCTSRGSRGGDRLRGPLAYRTRGRGSPVGPREPPDALPAGNYRIDAVLEAPEATNAALGWALGCYRFDRYSRAKRKTFPALVWPRNCDRARVRRAADATFLVRDLINTPADDMGPADLATAARRVARAHGARVRVLVGDALLRNKYPTIHAVGRASPIVRRPV